MDTAKNNILNLLQILRNNEILNEELHDKLKDYLWKYDGDDDEYAAVEQRINDLLPLKNMNKDSKGYDEDQIQRLSKNLVRAMESNTYSIVQLLIKIKLIYTCLLKKKCEITKENVLCYRDESSDELLPSIEDEQQEFLNELIDAPIDDIAIYLDKNQFQFEDFYTTLALDELVNWITESKSNNFYERGNVLDHVYALFQTSLTKKYAPLTATDLINQINNQYHSNRSYKYRQLLEEFVHTKPEPKFTFDCFYKFVGMQSIFSEKQQQDWASIFKIYCLKLLNADQNECTLSQVNFLQPMPKQDDYKRNNIQRSDQKSPYKKQYSSKFVKSPTTRWNNLRPTPAARLNNSTCKSKYAANEPVQSNTKRSISTN